VWERPALFLALAVLAALVVALPAFDAGVADASERASAVRAWKIHYRAHNGASRAAYVLLPKWYGPKNNPLVPMIISPHGRGLSGRQNAAIWGNLPAAGPLAVVSPDGQGRRLTRYSWGFPGQIDDLARMPAIVQRALPWLRLDVSRIYAFGGSMGGQETLLLIARYPRLLAGAAVFDSVTDLALQYRHFPRLRCGKRCQKTRAGARPLGRFLQSLARQEIGGPPGKRPRAYAIRSPSTYAAQIAFSCVPLQVWWSVSDQVVIDQQQHSGRLFWELKRLNRDAPVHGFAGFWIHSSVLHARSQLPAALATFGLLLEPFERPAIPVRAVPPSPSSASCGKDVGIPPEPAPPNPPVRPADPGVEPPD
jgi:pimeloyl-ACP methyl ester carboxylesterase